MPRLELHPEAETETAAAQAWYEMRTPGLGRDFLAEVDQGLAGISRRPATWPRYAGLVGLHRYLLHRFPYGIVYRQIGNGVLVLAVMHLRRRPGYWRDRLKLERPASPGTSSRPGLPRHARRRTRR